jgi:hypothetical protein
MDVYRTSTKKSCLFSDVLHNFLVYVNSLGFEDQPDYDKCRGMFKEALKKAKHPLVIVLYYNG